jgi:hypothetical protein
MAEISTFQTHPETDFEVRSLDTMCVNESQLQHPWWYNFKYSVVGLVFGIAFVKAEIISWFRIQEMFRLQSFHMYGVIGTGVVLGALSVWLIKRFQIKTIYGENIEFPPQTIQQRPSVRGLVVRFRLGYDRCLPRPSFCPNRHRGHRNRSGYFERHRRHLGVWIPSGEITLMNVGSVRM